MNRPMLKKVLPQALAWTALAVLCGAIVLAQDVAAPATAVPETSAAPAAPARTDGQIEMDVVHALDATKELKSDLITAATIQGEVTLSGTVSDESSRELAQTIASNVQGVTKVNNNLTVGNPQAAATAESQPDGSAAPPLNDVPPPPMPTDSQAALRDQIRAEVQAEMQAQNLDQQTPKGPVTIPQGSLLLVRSSEPVNSKHAKEGQPVQFVVIQSINIGGVTAIPRGATVHGVVTEVKQAGDFKGSPELALKLTSLEMGGQSYPLDSEQLKVRGPGKGERTANNMIGGTMMGTIIGCIAGRGVGCAIGAGAGLAAGTAASAATPGPNVWIPAEARLDFHLAAPLTVTPVSGQEAARLAQGLYPGGPTLYRRYDPYGRPYSYYGYPRVYYRPYYFTGGFYYWSSRAASTTGDNHLRD